MKQSVIELVFFKFG